MTTFKNYKRINFYLLAETVIVFIGLVVVANLLWQVESGWKWLIYLPVFSFTRALVRSNLHCRTRNDASKTFS